ncbi:DUF2515 family protein [Paenibacillus polymyxa]|uniref:DUF2515 family protein n=1 Tax=Paenibacillus TaxID=44249 RepID=UPI00077CB7FC|nr:DUF2515 family protein [Paenibacillus polymyxa]AOK89724.1 hypothetical protein AOU00_07785 [Paenibacillus polymyxa]KYG94981.1 hypothetical protein AZE31_14315 [Paenibacillus polymyxa]
MSLTEWLHTASRQLQGGLKLLGSVPRVAEEAWEGKRAAWTESRKLRYPLRQLAWDYHTAQAAMNEAEALMLVNGPATRPSSLNMPLCETDCELLERIKNDTAQENRSNVTRTAAYLECYRGYPELHWALLAHLVSRNGGYNMTDLKGGLIGNLFGEQEKEWLYRLLERCNALIFQDAYPQLQLYMHSRHLGRSCFHLLPYFHISPFMKPFWERFWAWRDSSLLTVALIINEQNYIEGRVIKDPYFQKFVTHKPGFYLHDWLQLNQVIFPLGLNGGLAGLVMERFGHLDERIGFGKSLYAMLFGHQQVLDQVSAFANSVPHTGSRSDYWPGLFTPNEQKALHSPDESATLLAHEWLPPGQRLYSPELNAVWSDTAYDPIPRYDWFQDGSTLGHLSEPRRPLLFAMRHEHRHGIQKTAMAHVAHNSLQPFH